MKTYTVFFEAFGRKMRTEVRAKNETDAQNEIYKKIKFVKVVESEPFDFIKELNKAARCK